MSLVVVFEEIMEVLHQTWLALGELIDLLFDIGFLALSDATVGLFFDDSLYVFEDVFYLEECSFSLVEKEESSWLEIFFDIGHTVLLLPATVL